MSKHVNNMASMETAFETACSHASIPGAVLASANKTGTFTYAKAFGFRSLEGDTKPACELDTIMALFSATKLVTTICALQLVEKGLIGLDEDTAHVLPELADLPVLVGMKSGTPEMQKRRNPITLTNLLTHSSGLAYSFMSPLLREYNDSVGQLTFSPPQTVVESYSQPLVFQPGTSWTYSTGLDWVGLLVSRLSKMTLEEYVQKNIVDRLGIKDMTFWPDKNPELKARLAALSIRDQSNADGPAKAVPYKGPNMASHAQEEFGGQGLYASMPSYLEVLKSILADDERLLSKKTTAMMFKPHLTKESQLALQAMYESQPVTGPCSIGQFNPDVRYDWGLGGLLTMEDSELRRKGCLNWSGMPNLFWFLDREAGVCGIYGGQLMPAGDGQVKELITMFERMMYTQAETKSSL